MIDSYTNTSLSIAANAPITFNANSIQTGCTATHAAGTATFSLNKPGFYYVTFNGTGTVSGAAAGNITVTLQNNGVAVPGGTASVTSASTTDIRSISFSKIIQIRPSCCAVNNRTQLTFVNAGVAAIFSNVNVVITKLA